MLRLTKITVSSLIFLVFILLTILFYNTVNLNTYDYNKLSNKIYIDHKSFPDAVKNLSNAIKIKTISDPDSSEYSQHSFKNFIQFVINTYPDINNKLELKIINNSLLYKWRGENSSLPAVVIMAHYDTVPVPALDLPKWKHEPFSGAIDENKIWGRGAIDDKGNLIAILEAVNKLLQINHKPKHDIYFAFGEDEELNGTNGNIPIVNYLSSNNIKINAVFDEGVPIMNGLLPFVNKSIATISIAEKGYASFLFKASGSSGHSSVSSKNNVIVRLSKLLAIIDKEQQPSYWTKPLTLFIESLIPHVDWQYKLIFANLWLTKPLVKYSLEQSSRTQTLLQTAPAITKFNAGIKDNVIPTYAEAIVNYRIIHGDTIASIKSKLEKYAEPFDIKVEFYGDSNSDPVPCSPINNKLYTVLESAIEHVYPEAIVAPSIMVAMSDSRHYNKLTPNIYRVTPFMIALEDIESIHGINESMRIDSFIKGIYVYTELIKNL